MGRAHQRLAEAFVYEARENWEWYAACIGKQDLFFPGKGAKKSIEQAKAICDKCPVFSQCEAKTEADPPEYGVWAGRLFQPNGRP